MGASKSQQSDRESEDSDATAPFFGSWRRWYTAQIVALLGFIALGVALSLHYR